MASAAGVAQAQARRSWRGARARPLQRGQGSCGSHLWARFVSGFMSGFIMSVISLSEELIEIITYVAAAWKSKLALGL